MWTQIQMDLNPWNGWMDLDTNRSERNMFIFSVKHKLNGSSNCISVI